MDLSTFWMSYMDMVEIVLGLVRASREGVFEHHLMCIRAMIPWCFAYNRLNYARYLPYYFATMCRLSMNYPDVYQYFMQGGRILKNEADVQSIVNLLMEDSWINPFRSDQDSLVSLATAAMSPMEIAHDLMNASKVGEEAFEAFRIRRLENNTVDFVACLYTKMCTQRR